MNNRKARARTVWGVSCLVWLLACGQSDDGKAESDAGDPRTQARSYALEDVACETSADCCVVYDGCWGSGLVVARDDRDTVRALLDQASQDKCVGCVLPGVEVQCTAGVCVGSYVMPSDPGAPKGIAADHCGMLGAATAKDRGDVVNKDKDHGIIGCGP